MTQTRDPGPRTALLDADAWWRHGVIYQVYPRSFQDSDDDGVGDLAGIRRRVGHFADLGIDAVWISPIYPSPMADFGYDVADYCGIDPLFGTLADFDALLADLHAHGLKLILDFVPNHSSDRHPWFVESRRSRASPLRDFYLWRDGAADGGPPNNWRSQFGGPAWTFDERTGQWYYHAFLPQQPDLNWRNPQLRARMFEAMRFWLERGVDGFRVDVIWHLIKDKSFRDNPRNPHWHPREAESKAVLPVYSADRPELGALIEQMRAVVGAYDTPTGTRVLIGEIYLPIDRLVDYYGLDDQRASTGVHLPFNFHLMSTDWNAPALAELILRYERALPQGAWPNWVLGNHDQPRIASRIGARAARCAAMLLLTLRGTPTLYYGDELGMEDVPIPPDRVRDPAELREPGKGLGRDPQRAPMPWSDQPGAGFTRGEPWLPLPADHATRNVEALGADPESILALYRRLLALRRAERALHAGAIESVRADGERLSYQRSDGSSRLLIELNVGAQATASLGAERRARMLLSSVPRAGDGATLSPHEGRIWRLSR